jgi:hypothetical protein
MNSFWDAAIAICRSTRSPDQRLADAARQAAADEARQQREAEIAAEDATTIALPVSVVPD